MVLWAVAAWLAPPPAALAAGERVTVIVGEDDEPPPPEENGDHRLPKNPGFNPFDTMFGEAWIEESASPAPSAEPAPAKPKLRVERPLLDQIDALLAELPDASVQAATPPPEPRIQETAHAEVERVPPSRPLRFSVAYRLMSDYVFRGINYSEYRGEGREKLNHQMTTTLDIPLGKKGEFGTFGFDTFFEWYAAQKELTGSGANIQEIDYTLRWGYHLAPLATTATFGWTDYTYQHVREGDPDRTNEAFVKLEHNDAWMWRPLGYRGDTGVLNPYLLVALDLDVSRGVWLELGIDHEFELVRNLTLTPSMVFAVDGGYTGPLLRRTRDHDTGYAYTQVGMDVTYDLTEVLRLPAWAGSVKVSGLLYYTNATDSFVAKGGHDEFWGGMSVGWTW